MPTAGMRARSQPEHLPVRADRRAGPRPAPASPIALEAGPAGSVTLARPSDVIALQARAGNRAVSRLVADVQRAPAGIAGLAHRLPTFPGDSPAGASGARLARMAGAHLAPLPIQRKPAIVASNTYTKRVTGVLDKGSAGNARLIRTGSRGARKRKFDTLEIFDTNFWHVLDAKGRVAWYRVKDPAQQEFIAAKDVLEGFRGAEALTPGRAEPASADKWTGPGGDLARDLSAAADDPTLEWARRLEIEKKASLADTDASNDLPGASPQLTQAEGGLWLGAGIFGMAAGFRDFADSDKTAWERANGAFGFLAGSASAIGASSQIASTLFADNTADKANATGIGAWSLGFSEMFTGLAAGVKTIKAVVDLIRMIADDKRHGGDEWVATSGALLVNGLETAKGVLRSIRAVNEALAGGQVSSQFKEALPGLDIAILAVKSIMQGYYLAVSAVNWHRMSVEKEQAIKRSGRDAATLSQSRRAYRAAEAKLTNIDVLVREKERKIAVLKKRLGRTGNRKKREAIEAKLASLEQKRKAYTATRDEAALENDLEDVIADLTDGPSRGDVEEVDLANALKVTNRKRVVRQSLHITTNLIQVAGSIATYVSGPGAPAALGLKAAAMGIDISLPFFRWIKQKGRDAAARNAAKGEPGKLNKIFNADKSSAAKLADRKKQAVALMKMVGGLYQYVGQPALHPKLRDEGRRVEMYLSASGVDTDALYRLNGNTTAQVNLIVKALAARELGD